MHLRQSQPQLLDHLLSLLLLKTCGLHWAQQYGILKYTVRYGPVGGTAVNDSVSGTNHQTYNAVGLTPATNFPTDVAAVNSDGGVGPQWAPSDGGVGPWAPSDCLFRNRRKSVWRSEICDVIGKTQAMELCTNEASNGTSNILCSLECK